MPRRYNFEREQNRKTVQLYGASQSQLFTQALPPLQDYGTKGDSLYLQTLQNSGIAAGTEGSLQLAVLVLSILAALCSLIWIWGFIFLRIRGLLYVKKQVKFHQNTSQRFRRIVLA